MSETQEADGELKAAVERARWVDWTDPKSAQAAEPAVVALVAYIDGEPGRLAAAREEQREVCARAATPKEVEVLQEDGTTLVEDEEVSFEELVERVRATPLDSAPLGDRIKELESKLADRDCDSCIVAAVDEARVRAEKAEARVRELEAVISKTPAEHCAEERSTGNGGCGACSWCCQQWKDRADALRAQVKSMHRDLLEIGAQREAANKRADEMWSRATRAETKAVRLEAERDKARAQAERVRAGFMAAVKLLDLPRYVSRPDLDDEVRSAVAALEET